MPYKAFSGLEKDKRDSGRKNYDGQIISNTGYRFQPLDQLFGNTGYRVATPNELIKFLYFVDINIASL